MAERTAVVTGAGRGIGLAIVRALADDGYTVIAGARTPTEALRRATPHVLQVDLAAAGGPERLIGWAQGEHGGIDLLVNNVAGASFPTGGFLELDDAAWRYTFDATFMSAVRATRSALPSLIERRGAVVNIGSVNSRLAQPRLVAQSAAKAALANLGKALAEEFGGRGVRVNTVLPGPVRTDVWTRPGGPGDMLARRAGSTPDAFQDELPDVLGLSTSRLTEPEEVAALVVFLASGRVRNMSGSELVIDGGMLKSL
ncbi:NAD(P)-dependent dehydrogenase (short-subunit alcohol dehydrogenase family) [Pseudonocardia hierapolitana]|uniref:NAD(P)-dependent dehydrogenase (Short-subunit alcohol dehydrogenase family) n=1 Tax=Pseudonocardia hierapolitana TaxID=1128676 RepID=A0A561SNS3_9PSEU|nr:SDR family oxidoreductase [Pseudonocardia hierapolitana]TWF76510.1 NAD(P)-dependent dehydrogenase (short-subunit alcohol dehydrogenase family) [Pseudonocardia hierapolitana]